MRGDVYHLRAPKNVRGHEQSGQRYAVVVQSDELMLSTILIAPTSKSARPDHHRPAISIGKEAIRVLVEQTTAVDPSRLGKLVGHLSRSELDEVSHALRLVLELD